MSSIELKQLWFLIEYLSCYCFISLTCWFYWCLLFVLYIEQELHFNTSTLKRLLLSDNLYLQFICQVVMVRMWAAALAQVHTSWFKVQTLSTFNKKPNSLSLFPFIPPSEVVVFLLDVSMCVLEAERLDVVGDVSDASVEFLRSWSQRAVVIPAGKKKIQII